MRAGEKWEQEWGWGRLRGHREEGVEGKREGGRREEGVGAGGKGGGGKRDWAGKGGTGEEGAWRKEVEGGKVGGQGPAGQLWEGAGG